jgi:site-specific recombinase XerD
MESDRESKALVAAESRPLKSVAARAGMLVPRVIAEAGDQAARRFLEFFAATIRNKNTRQAYYHATVRFFAWCDRHKIGEIADIEPLHVAAYIEALGKDFEKPTVKQHLAAIRMLFDWLSPARSSRPTRPMRSADRSMSSRPARRPCSPLTRPAF